MEIFIIGLGNPEKEYEKSPHNTGFEVIDKISKKNQFGEFKESFDKKYLVSKGKIGKKNVALIKPLTFMNNSGEAIRSLIKKSGAKKENLWVVHDEIDLQAGKIKISQNKKSAGHKGVESIVKTLKSNDFARFRIGTCPFKNKSSIKDMGTFLLKPQNQEKLKLVNKGINNAVKAIETALENSLAAAMTQFNK
ncbi:MAG: aminoacyl-tRNA hydrolase [bacterium]|nr:aminoacyl-tRNA hydrolase [bacterium]